MMSGASPAEGGAATALVCAARFRLSEPAPAAASAEVRKLRLFISKNCGLPLRSLTCLGGRAADIGFSMRQSIQGVDPDRLGGTLPVVEANFVPKRFQARENPSVKTTLLQHQAVRQPLVMNARRIHRFPTVEPPGNDVQDHLQHGI